MEDALTRQSVGVYCLDEKGPRDLAAARRFLSILRKGKYDIVHVHCPTATSYQFPTMWLVHVPRVVCTFHMTPGLPAAPAVQAKAAISRLLARYVSRHVDWIYGCSAAVLTAQQQSGWRGCPSSVIYNGIDGTQLRPPLDKAPARAALGMRAGELVIGSVGSLCVQKGHSVLIRAFPQIRNLIPNACLLIVGSGPNKANLSRLAHETGFGDAIHIVGERADVMQSLRAMDVFAFPSLAEGFGIALAEAMACGVPVVASAVGGIPELVTDDVSGLLVPPEDSGALANAIVRILKSSDLADRLSAAALRVVTQDFPVARMILQVNDLYTSLLSYK